jgi:hypothetical protein
MSVFPGKRYCMPLSDSQQQEICPKAKNGYACMSARSFILLRKNGAAKAIPISKT